MGALLKRVKKGVAMSGHEERVLSLDGLRGLGALAALLPKLGIADPLAIAVVSLPASMLAAVAFWRTVEVPSMNLSRSLASR